VFLASVGENDYGEADDESGNQGREPFWESIEHGGDDPTLEFAAKVSLEAPLAHRD
jgi:hypothetical protein